MWGLHGKVLSFGLRTLARLPAYASLNPARPAGEHLLAVGRVPTARQKATIAPPQLLRKTQISLPPLKTLVPELQERKATPKSKRTGVIGIKVGMTREWDIHGVAVPSTVVWIDDCQVVQVKMPPFDVTTALQVGCGAKKEKQLIASRRGHFKAAGVPLKRKLAEFPVTPDALLPVGTELTAAHFRPGQYVDVTGTTIGKGFQGVMKRWGFKGGPASHGVSKAHRVAGSTGSCQDPGRVWKGKKMAGHMGNKRRTAMNVWVHKVDPARNLIWLAGTVPGHKGNFVLLKDAARKQGQQVPFPTHLGPLPEAETATPRRNRFDIYNGV